MPSISMGFWVATTMKGRLSSWVTPSADTWRSAMASSRADWVLGEARLISSATTTLAKIPPGLNSNSRVCWLNTDTPVMSAGSRSGVNCIRCTVQSIERPRARASIVLPTPGTSSSSRWPPASRVTRAVSICSVFPSMTLEIAAVTSSITVTRSCTDSVTVLLLFRHVRPPDPTRAPGCVHLCLISSPIWTGDR